MFPFSEGAYKWLKWIASIFFPAFIALFAGSWAILAGQGIVPAETGVAITGILGLFNVFSGSLVQISTAEYNKVKDALGKEGTKQNGQLPYHR